MELYQFIYFRAVSLSQSYTIAANEMNVSQPTISIAIQKLEKELGVQLIEKKDKPIRLTPIGHVVLERVNRILTEIDNIKKEIDDFDDNMSPIRFGIPLTFCNDLLMPIKAEFSQLHENIPILVSQYGIEILEPELASGNLDLCILCEPISRPEVECTPFRKMELIACFSNSHPFAALDRISPETLVSEQLLIGDRGRGVTGCILDYFAKQNVSYQQPDSGLFSPQALLTLAEEGMGVALIEKNLARQYANIICRPLDPPLEIQMLLAWNRTRYISKGQKTFVAYLKKLANDNHPFPPKG